ncbi:hypothetical protein H0A36_03905 [Endozoicomonas sp. SM1973]|uniref:Uncharacterized protein n=1 Tax=Spartinivicinus marinus TaxID=2994442 RepID=A0A853HTP9_9GAMM|nr:hypothetical protein [Spartinivicinus marinus]MCX4029565.1 hypothetical protein [Spartinivicinus marinus]NYZ65140.1 hypothetical protein [Spartinivicinus marinus]
MTKVADMKKDVLKIMKAAYEKASYNKIEDKEIYEKGFLLENHATSVREACEKYNLQVSFRAAGMDTLERISKGNPCKGHTIMDKSIKKKNGLWTYSADEKLLNRYKGLVGYPEKNTAVNGPKLGGIWKLNSKGQEQIPVGDLNKYEETQFFTGDYDMHDLLKENKRILAGTPDESSTINSLLVKMNEGSKTKIKDTEAVRGRWFNSQYAWIRHGAQTSFISYLLDQNSIEEMKEILKKTMLFRNYLCKV